MTNEPLLAQNSRLKKKIEELRADIHENGNRAMVIQAEEVLAMRKSTARQCANIAAASGSEATRIAIIEKFEL